MNRHPSEEHWMEFLYGELPASQKSEVERHLQQCAECRTKRAQFESTQRSLDTWRVTVPAKFRVAREWSPALKWAAAAALLVTTAFAAGRFSRPEVDLAAVQASLSKPIEETVQRQVAARLQAEMEQVRAEAAAAQAEMASQMRKLSEDALAQAMAANKQQLEQLARTVAAVREEDRKLVYASLKEIESQLAFENRKLREGIETVALVTDRSLKDAQRKLVQLASYTANAPQN